MYQCDESQHFIMVCINMMENGSHRDISTTLLKFLRCVAIYNLVELHNFSTFAFSNAFQCIRFHNHV